MGEINELCKIIPKGLVFSPAYYFPRGKKVPRLYFPPQKKKQIRDTFIEGKKLSSHFFPPGEKVTDFPKAEFSPGGKK